VHVRYDCAEIATELLGAARLVAVVRSPFLPFLVEVMAIDVAAARAAVAHERGDRTDEVLEDEYRFTRRCRFGESIAGGESCEPVQRPVQNAGELLGEFVGQSGVLLS
jgi:hypothetical protein